MNENLVKRLVNATLYEGYMLYPYRPSAVKNRKRFNFGVLAPRGFAEKETNEKWQMQTECLVEANEKTTLNIGINFLHLTAREIVEFENPVFVWNAEKLPDFRIVPALKIGREIFQTWDEAIEREVKIEKIKLKDLLGSMQKREFSFPQSRLIEPLRDQAGKIGGAQIYRQQAITGEIEFNVVATGAEDLYKISVRIFNTTPLEKVSETRRDEMLLSSFISAHTVLNAERGEFVSLFDVPEKYQKFAATCENTGTFPVLVGEKGERDCLLSSPIILYDYPEIAPESAGDMFDGLEIDEILMLRIMTMTEEEKREMRGADEHSRKILERTENLPLEQLAKLHGAMRKLNSNK